jgi:tRNA threonylcarbamoyladenosine biosynthesis protein TsaE
MNEFTTYHPSDLEDAVDWVLKKAKDNKKIMLYGEMGAGKTTFVKAFCKHFGVKDKASSPTFSLVNEYIYSENGAEKFIHHMDFYRLKTIEEAMDIGIEEYLYDDSYCLIEWPHIIEPILPDNVFKINMEIMSNSTRKIVIL